VAESFERGIIDLHQGDQSHNRALELASAKPAGEMWIAYSRSGQKAVEDYAAAYGQMIKLGSGFIKSGVVESPPQGSKAA